MTVALSLAGRVRIDSEGLYILYRAMAAVRVFESYKSFKDPAEIKRLGRTLYLIQSTHEYHWILLKLSSFLGISVEKFV